MIDLMLLLNRLVSNQNDDHSNDLSYRTVQIMRVHYHGTGINRFLRYRAARHVVGGIDWGKAERGFPISKLCLARSCRLQQYALLQFNIII